MGFNPKRISSPYIQGETMIQLNLLLVVFPVLVLSYTQILLVQYRYNYWPMLLCHAAIRSIIK